MSDDRRIAQKQDVWSLDNLIAWLRMQPAENTYDFWCNDCLLGTYFKRHGIPMESIGTQCILIRVPGQEHFNRQDLPAGFIAAAGDRHHDTYGAALDRALKFKQGNP